ncbi:hypothetical protein Bbad01_26110 [Bacillus badius]|nr:hypothetical protein Bbad01_26110 [Bacillus badius]
MTIASVAYFHSTALRYPRKGPDTGYFTNGGLVFAQAHSAYLCSYTIQNSPLLDSVADFNLQPIGKLVYLHVYTGKDLHLT